MSAQNSRLKGIVAYSYCVGQQIERIVSLALPDKKYEHNQSSLYKVLQVWYQRGALPEHSQAVGKALQHVKSLGPVRTEEEERAEMQRHEVRSSLHPAAAPFSCCSCKSAGILTHNRVLYRCGLGPPQEKRQKEIRMREQEEVRRDAERALLGSSGSGDSGGPPEERKRRQNQPRRDTEMEGRKGDLLPASGGLANGKDEGELLAQIEKERSSNKVRGNKALLALLVLLPRERCF